jgi:hypothetical protein
MAAPSGTVVAPLRLGVQRARSVDADPGPVCLERVAPAPLGFARVPAIYHQRTVSRYFSDWGIWSTLEADSSSMK